VGGRRESPRTPWISGRQDPLTAGRSVSTADMKFARGTGPVWESRLLGSRIVHPVTTTTPVMSGCGSQWYWYTPGSVNVMLKLPMCPMRPESMPLPMPS